MQLPLMASSSAPDAFGWVSNLPPIVQWSANSMSLCIWTSESTESTESSLYLSITKSLQSEAPYVTFSISTDCQVSISLWTSDAFSLEKVGQHPLNEEAIAHLFINIINGVLKYGPNKKSSYRIPSIKIDEGFAQIFNLAFLSLTFLVCIYEAPQDLRWGCINTLRIQLTSLRSREVTKLLVRILGSNLEEQWMRSLSLGITNCMMEHQDSSQSFKSPSPLFSYAVSASGLWKVQLYCPTVAMSVEDETDMTHDDRLLFSLHYQQLEGVIQLAYTVIFQEDWIDVVVGVDNIRCDVNSLVSETLMKKQGCGSEEKHFPSHISLQLTPTIQPDILSVSVSKSSDNPIHEVGLEKGIESSFSPPNSLGLVVSASEAVTMSMKPWKFEQSVYGNSGLLNWFLHDGVNGREVFSSKPSKFALLQPRAWFKNRYERACRPFTKQGGVIFAGDEYGERIRWKMHKAAAGKTMEWEIKGSLWLTYWPNKYKTFYSETRRFLVRVQRVIVYAT